MSDLTVAIQEWIKRGKIWSGSTAPDLATFDPFLYSDRQIARQGREPEEEFFPQRCSLRLFGVIMGEETMVQTQRCAEARKTYYFSDQNHTIKVKSSKTTETQRSFS